jgi:ribosomal protein S18 acetylase RimI-like enzyme
MLIRIADKGDLSIIAGLVVETQKAHAEVCPERYLPISLEDAMLDLDERLNSPGFIVAELDGCVVGYAVYNIVVTQQTKILRARQYCYLQRIGVDVNERDSGIGYELIEYVKNECHRLDIDDIELDVWAFNIRGQKFFEKVGFEPYGFKMKASL